MLGHVSPAERSPESAQWRSSTKTRNLRVLVADGDSSRNSPIVDALRKTGAEVVVAKDSADALARIRSGLPEVVFAETSLPDLESSVFVSLAKEISPEVDVVVITELSDLSRAIECTKKGAEGFIVRPNLADQIAVAIAKAKERKQLRELAHTDDLTSLFNHRTFYQFLSHECHRSSRHGHVFALLLMDIDNFKQYNDLNGHLVGDIALIKLGRILKTNIRATDIPARYGGDEFAVILTETVPEQAIVRAKRLRDLVSFTRFQHENTMPGKKVTVSIGVALFPEHGSTPHIIMQSADEALYKAKAEGRNRVCIYTRSGEENVQK